MYLERSVTSMLTFAGEISSAARCCSNTKGVSVVVLVDCE